MAKENIKPTRMIAGQITRLSRGAHDIRHDPIHDEIWITNPHASAVLTFRGTANGAEAPIRIVQGAKTRIEGADRVDVDPVHNETFIPNGNEILVFPREAQGDVPPIRVIEGPDTQLEGSRALAVDPVHNLIVTQGYTGERSDTRMTLLIFNRTDSGNVKPRGVIIGPKIGERTSYQLLGQMQVYPPKGWIIITVPGVNWSWEDTDFTPFVGIWSINDRGEVPPRWKLGGPKSTLIRPRGVVLEPKNKELIVADMFQNAVLTYYFPELF